MAPLSLVRCYTLDGWFSAVVRYVITPGFSILRVEVLPPGLLSLQWVKGWGGTSTESTHILVVVPGFGVKDPGLWLMNPRVVHVADWALSLGHQGLAL